VASYVIKRLLWAVALFFAITLASFVLFFVIPSEPGRVGVGRSSEAIDLRNSLGVQGPIYEEYGTFVWKVLHGSFGESLTLRRDVNEMGEIPVLEVDGEPVGRAPAGELAYDREHALDVGRSRERRRAPRDVGGVVARPELVTQDRLRDEARVKRDCALGLLGRVLSDEEKDHRRSSREAHGSEQRKA
jgi:hypothetical protein